MIAQPVVEIEDTDKHMKYRIMESHCGDAPERYGVFDWPCDKKAKEELEKIRKMKSNGMSTFTMEKIVVEEKTTFIA